MRKLGLLTTILAGLLILSLTVCAAPSGEINVAMDTDTPSMDPHAHAERAGVIVNWHLYDSLFFRQSDMTIVPHLAKEYKIIDPTTVELSLQKNVKFHNGDPFTADSVKFSLERILDPATKSPRITSVSWLKSVEIVDDYTVRMLFKNPYPLWMEELQNISMVPAKYIKEKGVAYFAEHPVGTGPYKFVSWKRGQEIVLTANENYWKGAAAIKDVVFKIIPDASTRVAAIMSGSVDILRSITPEDMRVLQTRKNLQVNTVPILRFNWIYFADCLNPDSPFADKRVRQAVNYAVNIPEIIDNILGGLGTRTVALNPMHFGYDATVTPYEYDPAKAKALLKEAGYADGFSFSFHYTPVNMIKGDEVYQAIQAQLSKVGINMKIQQWSGVGFMDLIASGRARPTFGLNWGSFGVFDGDAILYPFFRYGQQYGFYNDPELDKLIDAQHVEMDPVKRTAIMSEIQHRLKDEAPWLFMYAFHSIEAANANLEYRPRSDEMFYAYDMRFKK